MCGAGTVMEKVEKFLMDFWLAWLQDFAAAAIWPSLATRAARCFHKLATRTARCFSTTAADFLVGHARLCQFSPPCHESRKYFHTLLMRARAHGADRMFVKSVEKCQVFSFGVPTHLPMLLALACSSSPHTVIERPFWIHGIVDLGDPVYILFSTRCL